MKRVPPASDAAYFARKIRASAMGAEGLNLPLHDLRDILRLGRLEVFEAHLSAEEGMQEAMLVPIARNAFAISVDPTPRGGWQRVRPAVREALRRHRVRFRVAHEIAHTLFYRRTAGEPRRVVRDSPAQEAFCDEFARALLLPPPAAAAAPLAAAAVYDLQRRFDVSLEVAARSLAAAHGPDAAIALWYQPEGSDHLRLQWSSTAVRLEGAPGASLPLPAAIRKEGSAWDGSAWDGGRGQWVLVGDAAQAVARRVQADRDV